jgi:hemolysin activation/secretion protein
MVSAAAHAAPPAPLPPGTATPGAIGDTLKQPPALQPPSSEGIAAPAPQAPAAEEGGATVVVQHFVFSGNTLFNADALTPLLAEYLDKPITLGQIYEAADKVADFYVAHGYTLATVNVPAQKMSDGTLRLEVIEGRIAKIDFEGNRRYHEDILSGFVSQTKPGEVYRSTSLAHDLQQLNVLPGLAARAVVEPGTEYGTSNVDVKVQEDVVDGYLVLDNYGRKDSGEYRVSGSVTVNNPLQVADQLQVLGTHSTDGGLEYGYVDYSVPLNFYGLRFDANYGHAYFKTSPIVVDGLNNNLQLSLNQPWVRTAVDTFSSTAGYIHTDGNADLSGVLLSNTRINLLNLGVNYAHNWASTAVTQLIATVHTNFSQNTAALVTAPVPERNRERLRLEINAQQMQPLPYHLQLLGLLDAVYSPDPLADTEQFSIGGPTSIRGFPSSEARGDRGFYTQLTLRRAFALGRFSLVPRIYGDTGIVKTLAFGPASDSSSTETSLGLGTDLLYRSFDLKVDWAYPLNSTPVSDGRDSGRVYASLTAGF